MAENDQKHVTAALALAHACVEYMHDHTRVVLDYGASPPRPPSAETALPEPPSPAPESAPAATDENLRHMLAAVVRDVEKLAWVLGIEATQEAVEAHPGPADKPHKYLKPDGSFTNCMSEAFGLWLDHPCTQPIQRQARERLVAKEESKWLKMFRATLHNAKASGSLIPLSEAKALDSELAALLDAMSDHERDAAASLWADQLTSS